MKQNQKQHFRVFTNEYNEKDYVLILRALAIFSVICAHVTDASQGLPNLIISSLGTYGVGVFFILSGYFFFNEKRLFTAFVRRKINTILIPWFFCGSLDWLYVVLRKGGISLDGWLSSIFIHSHYYYLTVLMLCYGVTWMIRRNRKARFFVLCVSLVSIWMTGKGLIHVYPYVNVLNWIGYFIIGIEVADHNCLKKFSEIMDQGLWWLAALCIFAVSWVVFEGYSVSYWYHGTLFAIVPLMLLCFGCARRIQLFGNLKLKVLLTGVGKISFSIYLVHMPFAGVFKYIVDRMGGGMLQMLLPFAVLFAVAGLIACILLLPFKQSVKNIFGMILGVRS